MTMDECDINIETIILIQKWWIKVNKCELLKKVYCHLKNELKNGLLQDLSNKCYSINSKCKGDGCGLTSGILIDMLITEYFRHNISQYENEHDGECDMKICNMPLSLKKINGKSSMALDWSKNKNTTDKEYFNCHMIIINLKTEQWWKNKSKIQYTDIIPAGIYFVDKKYCKRNVTLGCNNKTNALIDSKQLYMMLKHSMNQKLCIKMPSSNKQIEFNIMNAFI